MKEQKFCITKAHIENKKGNSGEQHHKYGNFYSGLELHYNKITRIFEGNVKVLETVREEWTVPKGTPAYRIIKQLRILKRKEQSK